MHLSGTGIGDLGDVSLLPVTNPAQREVKFSHRAEHVRPGYYSVMLASGVRVELTATQRVAFHRYAFPADAAKGVCRSEPLSGYWMGQDDFLQLQAGVG